MTYFLRHFFFLLPALILFSSSATAQWPAGDTTLSERQWVDSVYFSLTPEQRIAQLFTVRCKTNGDTLMIRQVTDLVAKYNIGGICFFKGGPVKQAQLTNKYQQLAKTPMLISIDGEWGLGMRLDSTISFARQMTLGAMSDNGQIYAMGAEIGRQCKRLGIHINFAPVADINSNPQNPIINIRSFGEQKEDVSQNCLMYSNGLQDNGVMAVAKHFPGHGDAATDSHVSLPVISHSAAALDTLDLYPFKTLIKSGIGGIMAGHLFVPSLDSTSGLPSSLSPKIINELLKKKLGFRGFVFTDAMDMGGVADYTSPGKTEVEALAAGNDMLVLSLDVPVAISAISSAIDSSLLSSGMIESKCRKVLHLKYRLGLWKPQTIPLKDLIADLNPPQALQMNRELYNSSVTVLRNTNNLLPLQNLEKLRIASVVVGDTGQNAFQERLGFYAPIDRYTLPHTPTAVQQAEVLLQLKQYNLVIVGIVNTHPSPARNFGITDETINFVDSLQAHQDMVLDIFSIPYALGLFHFGNRVKGLLVSYQDNPLIHDVSAQVIMGGMRATGRLPVSAAPDFKVNAGISTLPPFRLSFASPEAVGIHSEDMAAIDSIANEGILKNAYPGCQVLVAKNGVVIYHKAFGHHTYEKDIPARLTDLYDLASITKVAATTLAVMRLNDEKKIEPENNLSKYLSYLEGTDKSRMKVREVMAHQAGLQPWIPFYKRTIKDGEPDTLIYKHIFSEKFSEKVADRLYISKGYHDVIFDSIAHSPLLGSLAYKYSDLDFLLMGDAVERISGKPLNVFVNDTYYKPLGLPTMGYHPLWHFRNNQITPTENDLVFRKQLIDGDVHDPAAAMLGGVAGHAGLFSNANDLAVLMQMLLWQGEYGGKRYISKATVDEYTRVQFPLNDNRRGMGFDKPSLVKSQEGPCSSDASPQSFGHSGFTGTFVWTDPAEQLVYIFLSNRVYPDAENNKLVKLSIRTDIQDVIYNAIRKGY